MLPIVVRMPHAYSQALPCSEVEPLGRHLLNGYNLYRKEGGANYFAKQNGTGMNDKAFVRS